MRILIAEDDRTSRTMLAAVLRKCAHEVVEAEDGAAALRIMQGTGAPRVAILDWMMPGVDGLEVCRRLRESCGEHPPYIIMLTSRSSSEDIVTGLEFGADDYLVKPYIVGELKARVGVGCRMVQLQDTLSAKIDELNEALASIRTLQGIIPICSYCRKIRDDQEGWRLLEEYVCAHTDAQFSHGICPDCLKQRFPGLADKVEEECSRQESRTPAEPGPHGP